MLNGMIFSFKNKQTISRAAAVVIRSPPPGSPMPSPRSPSTGRTSVPHSPRTSSRDSSPLVSPSSTPRPKQTSNNTHLSSRSPSIAQQPASFPGTPRSQLAAPSPRTVTSLLQQQHFSASEEEQTEGSQSGVVISKTVQRKSPAVSVSISPPQITPPNEDYDSIEKSNQNSVGKLLITPATTIPLQRSQTQLQQPDTGDDSEPQVAPNTPPESPPNKQTTPVLISNPTAIDTQLQTQPTSQNPVQSTPTLLVPEAPNVRNGNVSPNLNVPSPTPLLRVMDFGGVSGSVSGRPRFSSFSYFIGFTLSFSSPTPVADKNTPDEPPTQRDLTKETATEEKITDKKTERENTEEKQPKSKEKESEEHGSSGSENDSFVQHNVLEDGTQEDPSTKVKNPILTQKELDSVPQNNEKSTPREARHNKDIPTRPAKHKKKRTGSPSSSGSDEPSPVHKNKKEKSQRVRSPGASEDSSSASDRHKTHKRSYSTDPKKSVSKRRPTRRQSPPRRRRSRSHDSQRSTSNSASSSSSDVEEEIRAIQDKLQTLLSSRKHRRHSSKHSHCSCCNNSCSHTGHFTPDASGSTCVQPRLTTPCPLV